MRVMRYMNLFSRISNINPKHCFIYNNNIIFVVQEQKINKAIGENGRNIKQLSEILQKKIKVVSVPNGISDAEKFISTIVYPAQIKSVELNENTMIINSAPQNKAMLIGRNKKRLEELRRIVKDYFGKEIRIM